MFKDLILFNGGFGENRTPDTRIFSPLLYQLSYKAMAVPTGIEPAIFCVTGRRDNRYTTEPWLREMDLNQRPSGYEPDELPNCSIPRYQWRRKRDSNPRAVADLPVFKTGPFNQTWVFLRVVPEAGLEPARDLTPAGF